MRTAAQEIAPQTGLKRLLQRDSGRRSIYTILVKGEFRESSAYFTKGFSLVMRS